MTEREVGQGQCHEHDVPQFLCATCTPTPLEHYEVARTMIARSTMSNGFDFLISWVEPLSDEDAKFILELTEIRLRRLRDQAARASLAASREGK